MEIDIKIDAKKHPERPLITEAITVCTESDGQSTNTGGLCSNGAILGDSLRFQSIEISPQEPKCF